MSSDLRNKLEGLVAYWRKFANGLDHGVRKRQLGECADEVEAMLLETGESSHEQKD